MAKIFNLKDKKKSTFSMKKKDTKAEIIIYGAIGESFWEDSVSAKNFAEELKNLGDDVKQIDLRLNSPGGSVFDGVNIYERLKQHKAKVTVYVDGLAASIASVIAMAGDEVIMGEGSFFMIHRPMTGVYGNASEMERTIDILDRIEAQMTSIYAKNTTLTQSEISQKLSEETWINAEEAVEMGFASSISDSGTEMRAVASMLDNSEWIKTRPEIPSVQATVRKDIKDFKNEIADFLARK